MTLRRGRVDWKISYYKKTEGERYSNYPRYLSCLRNVEYRMKNEEDLRGDFTLSKRQGRIRKFEEVIKRCKKRKFLKRISDLKRKVKE